MSDGLNLKQPSDRVNWQGGTVYIPPGHVWVRGDNPKESTDSNLYGPIPMNLIQGKITHKVGGLSAVVSCQY